MASRHHVEDDAVDDVDLGDADDAVDLDDGSAGDAGAPAAPGAGGSRGAGRLLNRWPAAVPPWARGPAAVVVLVVAAAALGAAVGSAHRGARDAQLALAQGVSVGYAFVAGQDERSGRLHVDLRVGLSNDGDEGVAVGLRGLTWPHQATTGLPEEVVLEGGGTAAAPIDLEVDCAAFGGAGGAARTLVLAVVRPVSGGGTVDVRMPVPQDEAEVLRAQLAARCGSGPGPAAPAAEAASAAGHSFLG